MQTKQPLRRSKYRHLNMCQRWHLWLQSTKNVHLEQRMRAYCSEFLLFWNIHGCGFVPFIRLTASGRCSWPAVGICSSTPPAACDAPCVQSVSCDVRLWELEKRCGNNWCGSACVLGTHGGGFCIDAAALCMRTSHAGCASQNLPVASTFVLMSSAIVIFLPWHLSGLLLAVVYSACVWFNCFSWFAPCFLISSVFLPCWLGKRRTQKRFVFTVEP